MRDVAMFSQEDAERNSASQFAMDNALIAVRMQVPVGVMEQW
jgi:hypothetical protein